MAKICLANGKRNKVLCLSHNLKMIEWTCKHGQIIAILDKNLFFHFFYRTVNVEATTSVISKRSDAVRVIIPPNINDPLNLEPSSDIEDSLSDVLQKQRRKRRYRAVCMLVLHKWWFLFMGNTSLLLLLVINNVSIVEVLIVILLLAKLCVLLLEF